MRTAKFVHDENIRHFQSKLKSETDPSEMQLLQTLIEQEEEFYRASMKTRGEDVRSARPSDLKTPT